MADEKKFKNPPFGVVGHRVYPSWAKSGRVKKADAKPSLEINRRMESEMKREAMPHPSSHRLASGTVSKAMDFVLKADKDNPRWKNAEKKIKRMFTRISSVGENQGLQPHMSKAQFPEKDVRIVKPDLKHTLKPEAKSALKDWYRGVYKVTKAFRYTCGNCGHSDAVHTIGGHPQPTKWGCAKCHADTKDIKPITELPVTRGKFKTEPVFDEAEKKKIKETGGFFKAEPQFKWPNAKKPREKTKSEQWREWAAERIKDANAGKFKKGA